MNKIKHSFGDVGLSPSPDPTLILDYSPITNYIKERIKIYEKELGSPCEYFPQHMIIELQAVLSKIEE